MKYVTTLLEDSVEGLYIHIGIKDPKHSIYDVASALGIEICYFAELPFCIPGTVTLDPQMPPEKLKEIYS
ncbi:hypothetical protein QGM71_00725 [Virgibacillus sp. C22-A2]|uniref:Uncharacterized protein n=1 Tax=Virgibacillus tibetensis TaxID=3042313 RepID=A0ABU6K9Z3_9BACI|nr:hypothetical protein [Virgibacillus sp. C22-A2]